jgi:hypothetical protein
MTTAQEENRELRTTLARLNARAWGIAMGLLLGGILFLATMILIMRGGPNPGQHLGLLRAYFPGYSVTVLGSFIGFVYGFVLGYALGRVIGMVYNRVVTVSRGRVQ